MAVCLASSRRPSRPATTGIVAGFASGLRALIGATTLAALAIGVLPRVAAADEIVVAQYGSSPGGWPYTVALAKGFFKDEGADISGIISSQGGGTTLRNILASNVPYAEVSPGALIIANQAGAGLKMVSDNVLSVADIAWVVKPDSPIRTLADLKGRKLGYTNPRSTTQGLAYFLLDAAKLKPSDVELVRTGGFGEGLAALDPGLVDVTPLVQPLLAQSGSKYRVLVRGADVLPPLDNTVGVTTVEAAASKGDLIRAILRARRKAVAFMYANPDESGDIIAKASNLSPEVGRAALKAILAINVNGVPYFGDGRFHMSGIERMVSVQKSIGALDGEIDLKPMIDTRFLPDDLKTPAN